MTHELQQNSPTNISRKFEITGVPFFAQTQYQCGPAALAEVLTFYGVHTTPEKLAPLIYIPDRNGSLSTEIVATTRRYGLLPYPLNPELNDLLREVNASHPILVMQNLGFDWLPSWHYAVVVGYDLDDQILILRSGNDERHQLSFATFERTWQRARYWALAITPPTKTPSTAKPIAFLSVVHDMETTQQNRHALQAYKTATRRWPHETLTWLALGNAYYQSNQLESANAIFRDGLHIKSTPELWNNYAYSLSASHCPQAAKQALLCGLKNFPSDENLLQSREELDFSKHTQHDCPHIMCF